MIKELKIGGIYDLQQTVPVRVFKALPSPEGKKTRWERTDETLGPEQPIGPVVLLDVIFDSLTDIHGRSERKAFDLCIVLTVCENPQIVGTWRRNLYQLNRYENLTNST